MGGRPLNSALDPLPNRLRGAVIVLAGITFLGIAAVNFASGQMPVKHSYVTWHKEPVRFAIGEVVFVLAGVYAIVVGAKAIKKGGTWDKD